MTDRQLLQETLKFPVKQSCTFWGGGVVGWLPEKILTRFGWSWVTLRDGAEADHKKVLIKNFPSEVELQLEDAPPWLGVWLFIIIDNTFHLTINHLALLYL